MCALVLESWEEDVLDFVADYERRVLVLLGAGDEAYESVEKTMRELEKVVSVADEEWGVGRWLLVVHGVAMSEERPSVRHLAALCAKRGVHVLSLQPKSAIDTPERYVVEEFRATHFWEPRFEGEVLGGIDSSGFKVGGSRYLFDTTMIRHIAGIVAVGGDEVALEEAKFATETCGLPLRYIRARVRFNAHLVGEYGVLDAWVGRGGGEEGRRERSKDGELRKLEEGVVLTMHQPWASLLVYGVKRVEGRVWSSDFRGGLWIHAAAKKPDPSLIESITREYTALFDAVGISVEPFLPPSYPTSCLLGCVQVVDNIPLHTATSPPFSTHLPPTILAELSSPHSFLCERPMRLPNPLPMAGEHKLWNLRGRDINLAIPLLKPVRAPEPVTFPRREEGEAGGGE